MKALLPQPGGFEGFLWAGRLEVNDLPISERPLVGDARFELDPGVPSPRSDSVNGDEAVPRADNFCNLLVSSS